MPYAVLTVTTQPDRAKGEAPGIDIFRDLGERNCLQWRTHKIDLHPPPGIVAGLDADAGRMLPLTVALMRIPSLQSCECVHGNLRGLRCHFRKEHKVVGLNSI
jgi:hypothetical protein